MPIFNQEHQAEYLDLLREARFLTHTGQLRRTYERTLWVQRTLFQQDTCWTEQVPPSLTALNGTWIMELVSEVTQRTDCGEWLEDRERQEDYTHEQKTPERMEDLARVAGYARIMFSSTVGKAWVSPVLKAYWFALSWAPDQREVPLMESTVMSSGHHVNVFPF